MIGFARLVCLFCLFVATSTVPVAAAAAEACEAVLTHAARNYMSRFNMEQRKAWVYSKKCGASSDSAGLDLLVYNVPISGSYDGTDQWCEDNRRLDAYLSVANVIESTVSAPAIAAWTSCMRARSQHLEIEHRFSPDGMTIQFVLKNRTPHEEALTRVSIQSHEDSGIVCAPTPTPGAPEKLLVNREVLVDCKRAYVDVVRNGANYRLLPAGSITVDTSLTSYLYSFPEKFHEQSTPPTAPARIALSLNGMHLGTRAYWSDGAHSQMLGCFTAASPGPDFEIVVLGTREVPAIGRGICGTSPYCDSAGESCREVYYASACYINREWHDWYKADSQQRGVPYSKESVCGT